MKSTRSSDMAVPFPRVLRAWTGRGPRTHRVRSVVSDEFAVLDHESVHNTVSGGRVPSPDRSPASTPCVKGARRVQVTPAEVGLPPVHGLRRTSGLRREELGTFAALCQD